MQRLAELLCRSGGPVVLRDPDGDPDLPWKLLGVHSSRIDMSTRDRQLDEALGLNSAWYADILLTLTEPVIASVPVPGRKPDSLLGSAGPLTRPQNS